MSDTVLIRFNFLQRFKCDEHYEDGGIQCCPWPGCKHGTPSERIRVQYSHGSVSTFHRAEWKDAEGHPIYSWQPDNLPRSMLISRVFWTNARRKKLLPAYDPAPSHTLYHYTSAAALLAIIESNDLFLTDYAYLNDSLELEHGIGIARERFRIIAERMPAAASLLNHWAEADHNANARICVASFSVESDSLTLWRAYGTVAIGFLFDNMAFGYTNSVTANHVVYDRAVQTQLLDLFGTLIASAYIADTEAAGEDQTKLAIAYANSAHFVHQIAPWLKHESFADEREVRLVHVGYDDVYDSLHIERPQKRFRASNGLLIPYSTTRDLITQGPEPELLPIAEIVIGPMDRGDLLASGVEELLVAKGYTGVTVRRSSTPFRN